MRLEALFHVSFYVTLALAAACLTLPSTFFLWWMPFFFAAIIGFFYLAWRHEGGWELSEASANQIGVFIAVGAAGWILFQIPRSIDDVVVGGVNWPAGLLPHLGPLLMVLLVVKLFRPKRLPDYWVIQTMGMMMVTLAAVLADDNMFGPLLLLYFASLVWSLVLYYPTRELASVSATTDVNQMPLFTVAAQQTVVSWRLGGLPRALRWAALVAGLGFVVFLAAPRQTQSQWNPRQLSNTSTAAFKSTLEAAIDLNRTGYVELSEEPAFSVTVSDSTGRTLEASNIQRWRQEVLEIYAGGRWFPAAQSKEANIRGQLIAEIVPPRSSPAPLAPGDLLVTFQVKPANVGGLVLAEPLRLDPALISGPYVDQHLQTASIFAILQGCDSFVPSIPQGRRRVFTYSQVVRAEKSNHLTPARDVHDKYVSFLASQPAPPSLKSWTHELLQRLPGLTEDERNLEADRLGSEVHAKVAQALSNHLSQSGEYRYTLELRREQQQLDPTVDFLMNVKEGHCERYAGGLALMLRTLGIRCRIVKGYLGADTDENGHGIVRHNQAHSWIQVLVPGELPGTWQWLTLDPTPSVSGQTSMLFAFWRWCRDNLLDTRLFWRQFVMEYTPEQQVEVLGRMWQSLTSRRGLLSLLLLAGAAGLFLGGRRLGIGVLARFWRHGVLASVPARAAFYEEFLRLAQNQRGLAPLPSQTPHEFAMRFAAMLQNADAPDLRDAPVRIVTLYYLTRYAGHTLSGGERQEVAQLLASLRARLAETPRQPATA